MRRRLLCLASLLLASTLAIASARAETVLKVGTGGAFTSIDPHYHNLTPNNVIADTLFSTLVTLDGNFKPVPALAESWKAVDDHTWEFKLRPGVKFSDGTPFTPDDVVFSFQRIPTVLNSPSSFNYAVKPVERIEIVDPLTIRLHTKQPEPLLPYFLNGAHIVSRKYGEGASTADYNSGKAAIGTGPYKLQSVLLGDRIVFVRNENYWGPEAILGPGRLPHDPNDASRTAAVQAGDVDIIDQVSTRDVATLQEEPHARHPLSGRSAADLHLPRRRAGADPERLRPRWQEAGQEPAAGRQASARRSRWRSTATASRRRSWTAIPSRPDS